MRLFTAILLLIFITEFSPAKAQGNFKDGYIIKLDGDTLSGFIKSRSQKRMAKVCLFKENKDANVLEFSPVDIEAYRFQNGKFFVSKKVLLNDSVQYVFLEFLINGQADLFAYKNEKDIHYYIQNEGDTLSELKNTVELTTTEESIRYLHENKEYVGWLKLTFKDYPEIYTDIDKASLEYRDLIKLTEKYHENVCDDYECIIYRKDTKRQSTIGLMAGTTYSTIDFNITGGSYPFMETEYFSFQPSTSLYLLFAQKNLFGLHERLSLNVNLGFVQNKFNSENISFYQNNLKIPIYLEYNFMNGKLSPTVSCGINTSVNLSSKNTGEIYSIIPKSKINFHQITALTGLGLEYEQNRFSYILKSNYEIGFGKFKDVYIDSYSLWGTVTKVIGFHFGFKYKLTK